MSLPNHTGMPENENKQVHVQSQQQSHHVQNTQNNLNINQNINLTPSTSNLIVPPPLPYNTPFQNSLLQPVFPDYTHTTPSVFPSVLENPFNFQKKLNNVYIFFYCFEM